MTANRRIFLNIVATYGRSLFSLVCGLFTARWVLMALGQKDYGLYGVVGGLTVFVTFVNSLLSTATSRFYAVSIGNAQVKNYKPEALENCRRWFSVAILIHTIAPCVFVCIGYPIGIWAINNFLVIPPERIVTCHWVFRFACLSSLFAMVNVPFQAMYTAKQYIAELTIYSIAQTAANFLFVYYMVTHPSIWLAKYAAWACFVSITPQIIICLRALKIFPECQFSITYGFDSNRMLEMLKYAFWQLFGCLGSIFRGQGIQILVNKYFGPRINASMTVANQVSAQSSTLAIGLTSAFQPAIATAYGAGRMDEMRALSFRACKFGLMLSLMVVLPVCLEIDEILVLWLKNPPPYCAGLCLCMIGIFLTDKSSLGHMMAVNASGKIALYQAVLGTSLIMTLPFAWLFVEFGMGVYAIGLGIFMGQAMCSWGRVWFARSIVHMSARYWLFKIVIPVTLLALMVSVIGYLPHFFIPNRLIRVLMTAAICELAYLPLAWLILDTQERSFIVSRIKKGLHRT